MSAHAPLELFEDHIRQWFEHRYAGPTDVQARSWPVIARGDHVVLTAPTGSGKTLTAFLWSLNQFATGAFETGRTQVLYVSPLKALNNDIQRNLLEPLAELARSTPALADVHVQVRSGDTPPADRQRMLRRPPEILITTPESLTLILTTVRGRQALGHVRTVILDEIHALVENRRGVMLMTAIERLAAITGEFQRIALSATVNPLDVVAEYVGGLDVERSPRPVTQVESTAEKQIEFRVRFPAAARNAAGAGKHVWDPLSDSFRELVAGNDSTLFFTNSRRLAENIALKINRDAPAPIAYAHHGSLAREIRSEVETRLKAGELRAIVATSSLEMGIDIGALDEVVLVQSPGSIASALQRIGRAGHRVGEVSRGTLYPTHAKDFVEAATLAQALRERILEPLRPIENPLDVLAQIIISTTAHERWQIDELYALITRSYPYRRLTREQFELVVEMLTGRYEGARIRDLKPRVRFDRLRGTLEATKGAVLAFYTSGGTIPDRGYFQLKHADTGAAIGELDEEFVWEAHIGQPLSFGSQRWQIHRITHNDVLVRNAKPGLAAPPFWRAEPVNRSFYYSSRIGNFLERCENELSAGAGDDLEARLGTEHGFEPDPAAELVDFLTRQREATGCLPHRHHLLIEDVATGPGGHRGAEAERQYVLHTFWGSRLNRPLALALQAQWRARHPAVPEIHTDNDAIIVQHKGEVDIEDLLLGVTSDRLDTLLRRELEGSGFFGARFRECAGRSLVLTRRRFNHRVPLWMTRLNAKKLMTATKQFTDFPVLLEAWRTCLVDEFELDALRGVLDELAAGTIRLTRVTTPSPSPFAAGLAWSQINRYMYADDTPELDGPSGLSDDLIRRALDDDTLRPRLEPSVIDEFVAKRQRLASGYAPGSADDLSDWLKERVLIPASEWQALLATLEPETATVADLEWLDWEDRRWATHRENTAHLGSVLSGKPRPDAGLPVLEDERDAAQLIREVLSFYGPVRRAELSALLPAPAHVLEEAVGLLIDEGALVTGALLLDDDTEHVCDADNLETLLRFQRAARRPSLETRPIESWPGFVAQWQGFGRPADDEELDLALDRLRGYPGAVAVWLDELLWARFPDANERALEDRVSHGDWHWIGCGNEQITFVPPDEIDLVRDAPEPVVGSAFRDPTARYEFFQLTDALREAEATATLEDASSRLWQGIWAGEISADSVTPLRQGLERNFRLEASAVPARRAGRRRARRPQGWTGNWSLVAYDAPVDAMERLELAKDRARVLLDRYGIVTRELANRDGGVFAWRHLFQALRVMELSGEVTTGVFFDGMSGPQFATPAAVRLFSAAPLAAGYWMNATDPAAPTGLGVDWGALHLPHRRPSNHLVFNAGRLVLVAERSAARLRCADELTDDDVDTICDWLTWLVGQRGRVRVEQIDDGAAARAALLEYVRNRAPELQVEQDHRGIDLTRAATSYTLSDPPTRAARD